MVRGMGLRRAWDGLMVVGPRALYGPGLCRTTVHGRTLVHLLVLLVVAKHPLQRDIEVTQFSVHPVGYYGKEQEMDGRLLCRSEDGHEGRHYI